MKKNLKENDAVRYLKSKMTKKDCDEVEIAVSIAAEIIRARGERNITQKELERLSGIKQPMITRIERGKTSPTIATVARLLAPLGKKLAVVPA